MNNKKDIKKAYLALKNPYTYFFTDYNGWWNSEIAKTDNQKWHTMQLGFERRFGYYKNPSWDSIKLIVNQMASRK